MCLNERLAMVPALAMGMIAHSLKEIAHCHGFNATWGAKVAQLGGILVYGCLSDGPPLAKWDVEFAQLWVVILYGHV